MFNKSERLEIIQNQVSDRIRNYWQKGIWKISKYLEVKKHTTNNILVKEQVSREILKYLKQNENEKL